MLARLITAALALSVLSPSAFAVTKLERRLAKVLPAHAKAKATRGTCASLKGSWVGTCSDGNGEPFSEWLEIDQYDCGDIEVLGEGYYEDYTVGGLSTLGSTSFIYGDANNFAVTADWEDGRKVLVLRGSGTIRSTTPLGTYSMTARNTFQLVDDKLLTDDTYKLEGQFDGQPVSQSGHETCTYSRK